MKKKKLASTSLGPCPFCGGGAYKGRSPVGSVCWIECLECGCGTSMCDDENAANLAWSRRRYAEIGRCDNCRGLEHERDELESELDVSRASLRSSYADIERLASYILSLNNGYPVANEQHPSGMGAVDAAIMTMEAYRFQVRELEERAKEIARMNQAKEEP